MDLKLLNAIRERENISPQEMADLLGFKSRISYWRIESGEAKKIYTNHLPLIAERLKLTNEEILKIFFGREVP